ncbi:hypothetical protein M0R45_008438 [Rubus argutus]|uniref:Uncharacterized protein n=1 Tax=Rubus argutus TaxID=59490 RepID=A0AAW1Y331_RUBAR
MSSAASNPRPQPPQPKQEETRYVCGGDLLFVSYNTRCCGEEVSLRPGDKIECSACNYPVLFKKRTRRIVEFQAR